MEIKITQSTDRRQKLRPQDSELGFGKYTTDHMFLMDYIHDKGWHNPRIEPYGDLRLDLNDADNTIQIENLTDGKYIWSVNCTDEAGNVGNSSNLTIYICS